MTEAGAATASAVWKGTLEQPSHVDFTTHMAITAFNSRSEVVSREVISGIPKVGGSPSEQVSLSSQSGIPTCVVCELGPLGPVPTVALSLPGVLGSPSSCDCEVGALPRPGTHFPCQAPETPSVGLPGVLINPACSSASSLGDSGLHSIIAPQVDAQIQNGDDLGCPCDQPDAIVIPSGSPAPASSLVAADRPLWPSVVKHNSPGGSKSFVDEDPARVSGDFGPNKDLDLMATDSLSPSISDAALLTSPNTQLSPVPISDVNDSSHSNLKSKNYGSQQQSSKRPGLPDKKPANKAQRQRIRPIKTHSSPTKEFFFLESHVRKTGTAIKASNSGNCSSRQQNPTGQSSHVSMENGHLQHGTNPAILPG
ncbi:hypothetical protein Nepgr_016416 [Nepenthes gracilis]|uniref:Uncharacterized protein n=1 Tax=Nepenthes gracilis TaxID=150966 RepID=A0AAD3SPR1_NEPGR|nr:hypothetical protein Nepgr_016416 [Nepenthes gracilis]